MGIPLFKHVLVNFHVYTTIVTPEFFGFLKYSIRNVQMQIQLTVAVGSDSPEII